MPGKVLAMGHEFDPYNPIGMGEEPGCGRSLVIPDIIYVYIQNNTALHLVPLQSVPPTLPALLDL